MDTALRHRINAGRVAVRNQVGFFRHQFGQVASEWKADDTRVTFADFAISERTFAELRNQFPDDDYCSEESNPLDEALALRARHAWIIDPIDGTNNYATAIPFCAISLALLRDGLPVYGFIYDYARDCVIHGGPDEGLCEDNRRVPPTQPELNARESLIGATLPLPIATLRAFEGLFSHYRVRALGSTALSLAYTALGLYDGCVADKAKVWDIAAGVALMAGARREVRFTNGPAFPLTSFHAEGPRTPFVGGTRAFLDALARQDAAPPPALNGPREDTS